jgi:hypothetical protein
MTTMRNLRALTLIRPFTDAIVDGDKRVENRGWPIPAKYVRQAVALHAGSKWDEDAAAEMLAADLFEAVYDPKESPTGIVAVVAFGRPRLKGWYAYHDRPVDPWFRGPYGWPILNVVKLAAPIPCKGALGLWRVPSDVASLAPLAAAVAKVDRWLRDNPDAL